MMLIDFSYTTGHRRSL